MARGTYPRIFGLRNEINETRGNPDFPFDRPVLWRSADLARGGFREGMTRPAEGGTRYRRRCRLFLRDGQAIYYAVLFIWVL